jgi:hypothetical protein
LVTRIADNFREDTLSWSRAERIVFGSPTGVTLAWGYRQVGAKMYLFVPSLGVPSESAIACTSGAG